VLQHTIDRLSDGFPMSQLFVVLAPEDHWFDDRIQPRATLTVLRCGGRTREATVRNALNAIAHVPDDDWIVVHDAVRPCVDPASLSRLRTGVSDGIGGLLAIPVSDTLKRVTDDGRVVDSQPRDGVWRAQTPQMFRYGLLRKALSHPDADQWTDEAHAVQALGLQPRVILGSAYNVKITVPEDLDLTAAVMSAQQRA
jgi:2-C-methyl-D-erythritol 4-phosphate cytidylyltransferase